MPELIQLNIPFIVILLAGAFAFALSYLFYRKTNPPVPVYARWILLILRAVVFWLLFLIFFTPVARLVYLKEKAEHIAVFVDNSKSMNVQDEGVSRWQTTTQVFKTLQKILPDKNVRWFAFNSQITEVNSVDSLQPSEGATDFERVLNFLRKHRFDKTIIVSDGVVTEGRVPNLNQRVQGTVFTIPVGKVRSPIDVFINEVKAQPTVYQNEISQVEVIVGVQNLKRNLALNLILKDRKKILSKKNIRLNKGSGQFAFTLSYQLNTTGLHHLMVEVETIKDESNVQNNRFHFVQEVFKSRKMVGLFTSYPNFDIKFLKLAIEKLPRFKAQMFVENNRGQFLIKSSLQNLDSMDIWIFVDFPRKNSSGILLQRLKESWQKRHQNLLLMAGPQFSARKFQQISDRFPHFRVSAKPVPRELTPLIVNTPESMPFVNLFDDLAINQKFWGLTPPLQTYHENLQTTDDAILLVQSSLKGKFVPLIFLSENNLKTVVINGLAFWRWHFLLQTNNQIAGGYKIFVEKLLGWLGRRTSFKPVMLLVDRKSGHIGQKFQLKIKVIDSRLRSVPNSSVVISVQSGQQTFSLPAQKDEKGDFKAQFVPVRAGNYKLVARGFQNNRLWGTDSTNVIIIPLNKELIHLSPDTLFLKKLATFNHGKLIPADSVQQWSDLFMGQKQFVRQEKEIEIWYKLGLLILILFLITTEWILRKRWNLI